MQSVPITTNVVSSNPIHGEVYLIQYYVIKFVSDLRQVCGFIRVLQFPPSIKLTATKNWNIVESGAKHHKPNHLLVIILSVLLHLLIYPFGIFKLFSIYYCCFIYFRWYQISWLSGYWDVRGYFNSLFWYLPITSLVIYDIREVLNFVIWCCQRKPQKLVINK